MLRPNRNLLALLGASVLGSLIACGDDASTSSSSSGGVADSGSPDTGSSSSGGKDGGTDATTATPEIQVSAPSKAQTTEDGDKVTFTVVLKSKPTADVNIAITSDKIAEGTVDKATLTFTAANFDTPQTVTITGVDDEVDDGDQDYKVEFAVTSTDTGYSALKPTAIAMKNMDNDTAGLMVGMPMPNKNTTEKGGKVTFTVRLRTKPSADVTIPVLSDMVTEGTADKATLTFTAANYKTDQTVTVTGVDENVADIDQNYSVKLGKTTSADAAYKDLEAKVDLTNIDDDKPVQVVGNWGSTCVRFVDGNVKCWGRNNRGCLGYGDLNPRGLAAGQMGAALPFVNFGTDRTVKMLGSNMRGEGLFCAIFDNDKIKCWGGNYVGQLGYGDINDRGDGPNEMGDNLPFVDLGAGRTAKAVTSGEASTCAILDNNTVKCWGSSNAGQLGYGDTNSRGDQPNEMGDNLPIVNLGAGRTAKAIAAGYLTTCAILDNDKVKCWGLNDVGQLGLGDTNNRGDQANEMGDNLPYVDLGTNRTAKAIVGAYRHNCALLDDNTVKCWGDASTGVLGQGNTTNRGNAPNQMGDNMPIVPLGAGRTATALYSTWQGACAILDNKATKCWGLAGQGQLGTGDTNQRGDNPNEMGDNLLAIDLGAGRNAVSLMTGTLAQCAILDNFALKCWGYNNDGQLGYGDQVQRGDNPNEMGANLLPIVLK
ncbi:MAG: hypothetical protein U0174_18550 [Polyangiaceae bacterium]